MEKALQVVTIQGVRGYADANNTVHLNVEDVARGLGFVMVRKERVTGSCDKPYTAVRWNTVNGYLAEFGYPHKVCMGDYIPENIFYRLAMKASNETAQKFQAKVADEILPSLRKHGVYMTVEAAEKILSNPDFIIKLAQQVKDAQAKIAEQAAHIATLQPKAEYCEKVLESDEHLTSELIAKEYGKHGQWLNNTLCKMGICYRRGQRLYLKAPYAYEGYRTSETVVLAHGKTVVNHYWTQAGRMFIYAHLRKAGIVPLKERGEAPTLFPEPREEIKPYYMEVLR